MAWTAAAAVVLALACDHAPGGRHGPSPSSPARELADRPPTRWRPVAGRSTYPLDGASRRAPEEGPLSCPDVDLVPYAGEAIEYRRPVYATPSFVPKLRRFEEIAERLGERIFGRPPERLLHYGVYACRRVRGRPSRLSEHAFGNGIDIEGFRFGPAPRALRAALPRRYWLRFFVTVEDHWAPADRGDRPRARFLHELVRHLDEAEVFRGMLGPRHPRHDDHFHFDFGPWTYRTL